MHYVKRRPDVEIVQWETIAEDFGDSLVLGNGASMAVSSEFSYVSLFGRAEDANLLSGEVRRVFEYLETKDFELVLNLLWHTHHVNIALGVTENATEEAYATVRDALVQAVRQNHAAREDVSLSLEPAYQFMQKFDTVVSLNYDLLVYWAMLEGNRALGRWFKDCFVNGKFERDWEKLRKPYGADGTTLVFYPHGNLALATNLNGFEFKVSRESDNELLLDRILLRWQDGDIIPLFVSEGDRRQKENAIRRSEYLSIVYNTVLPALGPTAVLYGWGMNDVDHHILRQIGKSKVRRMAISVHTGSSDRDELNDRAWELDRKLRRFMSPDVEWVFFDAASNGAWVN